MATQVEIATALIGDYCGDLRRAGFSREDILQSLKNGAEALKQMGSEPSVMDEIERMIGAMGFTIDEVEVLSGAVEFDKHGQPQCGCARCKARRAAKEQHNDGSGKVSPSDGPA